MKLKHALVVTLALVVPGQARAALTPSAEIQTDPAVYTWAPRSQTEAHVSFGSTVGLVIWSEGSSVNGTRVDRSGNALDRSGMVIAPSPAYDAKLACDHDRCLVVWSTGTDIKGIRVSLSGVLLDSSPFTICAAAGNQTRPAVAHLAGTYLVVWTDARSGSNAIHGGRITRAGARLDADGFVIGQGLNTRDHAAVVGGGDRFLVVWEDDRGTAGTTHVLGARVTLGGGLLDGNAFWVTMPPQAASFAPAVAWDGAVFWVASQSVAGVMVTRVAASNQLLSIFPQTFAAGMTGTPPSVACGGGQCTMAWAENLGSLGPTGSVIHLMRFHAPSATGLVNVTASSSFSNLGAADITFDGTRFLLAYAGVMLDYPDVFIGYVGLDGVESLFDTPVDFAANQQGDPSIAFNGTRYLVAWADYRANSADIRVTRFDANGAPLDSNSVAIAAGPAGQVQPRVAAGGSDFLVVWTDATSGDDDVNGVRVSSDGAVLDAQPIAIASGTSPQNAPAVASNGTDFAVLWADGTSIRGGRVTAQGTPLDGPTGVAIATSGGGTSAASPALARDGAGYVAAWFETTTAANSIVMSRLSSTLARTDSPAINIADAAWAEPPAVATGPAGYVVAWRTDSAASFGVRARVVNGTTGVPGTTLTLDTGFASMASIKGPALVTDGTSYVAAWQGQEAPDSFELRFREIDGTGAPIGAAAQLAVQTSGAKVGFPAVAVTPAGTGRFGIAYEHLMADRPYGAARVSWRMLGGARTCTSGTECTSTFCVDGVCCNSACGGGATSDCQACSVAAGTTVDGICGPVRAFRTCRAAVGACDVAELCDGTALTCPADGVAPDGQPCGNAALCSRDVCNAGSCTAAGLACAGSTCDPGTGLCGGGVVQDAGAVPDAAPDVPPQDAAPADAAIADLNLHPETVSPPDGGDAGADGAAETGDARTDSRDALSVDTGKLLSGDSGCSCRTGGSTAGALPVLGAMLALALARKRRRAGWRQCRSVNTPKQKEQQ